jgi:hypothetical protein
MKNKIILAIVIILLLGGGAYLYSQNKQPQPADTNTPPFNDVNNNEVVNQPVNNDLIRVQSPQANALVSSPLSLVGEARGNWYFEASFPVELVDDNGFMLAQAPVQAKGEWMTTEFVPFEQTLSFAKPSTPTGRLILHKDNPSGLPQYDDSITVPVRFAETSAQTTETMSVKVWLSDSRRINEPNYDCAVTKEVTRIVPKTVEAGRAALEALLRGATAAEIKDGYTSNLPLGARLKSLIIKDGKAVADFDDSLNLLAGSCRVLAVRAQITNTLKQFPTVKEVAITVNGRSDVLQP